MLDKFTDKMMESVLGNYMQRIQGMKEKRIAELEYLKKQVRKEPDIVEFWFDKEIERLNNLGSESLINGLHSFENGVQGQHVRADDDDTTK